MEHSQLSRKRRKYRRAYGIKTRYPCDFYVVQEYISLQENLKTNNIKSTSISTTNYPYLTGNPLNIKGFNV